MTEALHEQWHLAAARELDARVRNRMFFLQVTVTPEHAAAGPPPTEVDEQAWEAAGEEVERWLGRLDPDAVDEDQPPEHQIRPGDVTIELAAMPKKPKRRGTDPLIVNPYPGIVVFTGSYSTGPPPVFDDGT